MKIKFLSLFLFGLLLACSKPDGADANNHPIHFKDYQNKWIILNYWASWCTSCYKEIPELNRLYQQHKDKIALFGINYDQEPIEKIQAFSTQQRITYTMLLFDPAVQFGIHDNIENLPATFVIAPDRQQIKKLLGPQSEKDILLVMMEMASGNSKN